MHKQNNYFDFDEGEILKLWKPDGQSGKHNTGQLTIVGGSELFHGAPIMSLKVATRLVGMVYFCTPDYQKEVADKVMANLSSFIWVSYAELADYIAKSDVVLIGPGMMRNRYEKDGVVCDEAGQETRRMCLSLFERFADKQWVIDGGALQVLRAGEFPKRSLITPNNREFEMVFHQKMPEILEKRVEVVAKTAKDFGILILTKGEVALVSDGNRTIAIRGGHETMVKGGVGDVIAGMVSGLMAKNEVMFSAACGTSLVKLAGQRLASNYGQMYNADDLAETSRQIYGEMLSGGA